MAHPITTEDVLRQVGDDVWSDSIRRLFAAGVDLHDEDVNAAIEHAMQLLIVGTAEVARVETVARLIERIDDAGLSGVVDVVRLLMPDAASAV